MTIHPYDAAQRAVEIYDNIYRDHTAFGATDSDDLQMIYERLTRDWAIVSEQWDEDSLDASAVPPVPYWCFRALKRFANHFQSPMKEYLDGVQDFVA